MPITKLRATPDFQTLRRPCYSLNNDVMRDFDDFFIASFPWKYYDFVLKFQSLTPVWYEA